MDETGDRVPKHDLLVVDAVTPDQCDAIFIYGLEAAAHDLAQDRRIDTFLWKTCDGHGSNRRSGHRPHVVDGIQSCDASVVVRVVYDGGKEVERLYQREVVS